MTVSPTFAVILSPYSGVTAWMPTKVSAVSGVAVFSSDSSESVRTTSSLPVVSSLTVSAVESCVRSTTSVTDGVGSGVSVGSSTASELEVSVSSTDSTASTSPEAGASVASSEAVVLSVNSSANATVLVANIESSILAANAIEVTFCAILCIMRVSFLYSERFCEGLWQSFSQEKSSLHD